MHLDGLLVAAGTDGPLVVEDDIHEGAMNVQATVVFNEAQLPKLIHKETHPGPRLPAP